MIVNRKTDADTGILQWQTLNRGGDTVPGTPQVLRQSTGVDRSKKVYYRRVLGQLRDPAVI